jgi:phage-related protein (TIGR01555 family)
MNIYTIIASVKAFFRKPVADAALEPPRKSTYYAPLRSSETAYAPPKSMRDYLKPYPAPSGMAMDDAPGLLNEYPVDIGDMNYADVLREGLSFFGYPYLALLSQRSEYRLLASVRAEEMTRKWIKLTYTGENEDGNERVKELTQACEDFNVRDMFRRVIEMDGIFGRAHIFIDNGEAGDDLKTPLQMRPEKIKKGGLKGLRTLEPFWAYPQAYAAIDPLSPSFYRPDTWFVQAVEVHRTRLLTIVSKPVPDILKPQYAFGGLSLTQLAKPYVDNWLRTRQSVSDMLHTYSTNVLASDLNTLVPGGQDASDLMSRARFFSEVKDNQGLMVIDKNREDLKNVAAPLAGLHELQAQAQEQMAAVARTPLVKLLGITPSGLNANSEGEIAVFYDHIHAEQEFVVRPSLSTVLEALQLHLWGKIDPDIGFIFEPLHEMTEEQKATIEKTKAETDDLYVNMGAVDQAEVRRRLANDEESPYPGLDVDDVPEMPGADDLGPDDAD